MTNIFQRGSNHQPDTLLVSMRITIVIVAKNLEKQLGKVWGPILWAKRHVLKNGMKVRMHMGCDYLGCICNVYGMSIF